MDIIIPRGGNPVLPDDEESVEDLTTNIPVCPFCKKKIHRVVIMPSGIVNFYLCPECDSVLSVGEVRE